METQENPEVEGHGVGSLTKVRLAITLVTRVTYTKERRTLVSGHDGQKGTNFSKVYKTGHRINE